MSIRSILEDRRIRDFFRKDQVRKYGPALVGIALLSIGLAVYTRTGGDGPPDRTYRTISPATVKRLNRQLHSIQDRLELTERQGKGYQSGVASAPLETDKPSPLGPLKSSAAIVPPRKGLLPSVRPTNSIPAPIVDTSIARSPGEVIDLQKRGERNYQVFQVNTSKRFRRVGPVKIALRSVDATRQRFDIEMIVQSVKIEKKDVSLLERILLPIPNGQENVELVVNRIGEDEIVGYVGAPREPSVTASLQ